MCLYHHWSPPVSWPDYFDISYFDGDRESSLVTTLRVAEKFEKAHFSSPEVAPLIEKAKFFYVEGYFLTHGIESVLELSTKASSAGKVTIHHLQYSKTCLFLIICQTFALNISAPFIAQFFKEQLEKVLPYTDIVIGNESEAEAYANATGYPKPKDVAGIARNIALLPKANSSRSRIVIFTQGVQDTILVTADKPDDPKFFSVDKLTDEQIVDTNGAGDAFAGGLIGALVAGKDLEKAVLVGHALARASVQQVCGSYVSICPDSLWFSS